MEDTLLAGQPAARPNLHLTPHTPQPRRLSASELEPFRRSPTSPLTRRTASPFDHSHRASPFSDSFPFSQIRRPMSLRPRKRFVQILFSIGVLSLLVYAFRAEHYRGESWLPKRSNLLWRPSEKPSGKASLGALRIEGPKSSFRGNLRSDKLYITSWYHAGWTNDVIMGFNLIYLALQSGRIPVIPAFPPDLGHLPGGMAEAGFVAFSHIFDLPRLAQKLNVPIVEWHELKIMIPAHKILGVDNQAEGEPSERDVVGCWSTWLSVCEDGCVHARPGEETNVYNLNVHYTPIPPSFNRSRHFDSIYYDNLTDILAPSPNTLRKYHLSPSKELRDLWTSRNIPFADPQPDEQLACFDMLYYVSESGVELLHELTGKTAAGRYAGAWGKVGRFARWNPGVEELARGYLRRAFGIEDTPDTPLPPFIAVHIRRGDFFQSCPPENPRCLPTLEEYARKVTEVREALRYKTGFIPERVFMTTDEEDRSFLDEVSQMGWTVVDHEKEGTLMKYGSWYPTFLDSVMLSLATGFVGTSGSTLSILARRRVEDWNSGIGVYVPRYAGMGPPFDE